jgi:cytidylate kinase
MKSILSDRSPSLQRIVERQLRRWEIKGHQHPPQPPSTERICDFITISREIGSGGKRLAEALGARLGWKVYDRELLDLMADNEAERQRLYSVLDERGQSWMDSLLTLCAPETLRPRDDYLHALCRTLFSVVHQQPAIFVGRGAHFVLPTEKGLRVRTVARLADRIANLAKDREISLAEARRAIKQLEHQRLRYLKEYFDVETDTPEYYDLTINTSRLTIAQSCEVIQAALRAKTAAASEHA